MVVVVGVATWAVLTHFNSPRVSKVDPEIEHSIHMFAEPVKKTQSYSALPESKRAEFLANEAERLGLDTTRQVTPETLTYQCIDIHMTRLYEMARQLKDTVHEYQTALNHAQMEIRDSCYANYDPEGKVLPEEMPHMQAH